jgi:hypothetical protein
MKQRHHRLFRHTVTADPPSHAAHAFNVFKRGVHQFEIVRLCALWDRAKADRENIPTIIELIDHPEDGKVTRPPTEAAIYETGDSYDAVLAANNDYWHGSSCREFPGHGIVHGGGSGKPDGHDPPGQSNRIYGWSHVYSGEYGEAKRPSSAVLKIGQFLLNSNPAHCRQFLRHSLRAERFPVTIWLFGGVFYVAVLRVHFTFFCIQSSRSLAISRLFFSIITMCPLPVMPRSSSRIKSVFTPAWFIHFAVQ